LALEEQKQACLTVQYLMICLMQMVVSSQDYYDFLKDSEKCFDGYGMKYDINSLFLLKKRKWRN
jgi:hypothetical protein